MSICWDRNRENKDMSVFNMIKLMATQLWIYKSSKPPGFNNIELRAELLFWFSCNTAMMEGWFSKINLMKTSLGSCVYPKHSAGQGPDVNKWLRCTLYNPCGYFLLNLRGRSSKQCIFYIVQKIFDTSQPYLKLVDLLLHFKSDACYLFSFYCCILYGSMWSKFWLWSMGIIAIMNWLIVQFFSYNNNKYVRQTKTKIISAINTTIIS